LTEGAKAREGGNMLKKRLAAANGVATKLSDAERAIDAAIAKVGALMTHLPEAQSAANVSPVVGDNAYDDLQAAISSLFATRSRMVAFHHKVDDIRNQMGLRRFRIVGTGDAAKILEPQGLNDDAATSSGDVRAA
jgi:hypothetical protein